MNELASVNEKLEEKHDKLNKVHQEIADLKESYDSRMEKVNDAIESDKLITNYLNHHVSIMLKASILSTNSERAKAISLARACI